MDGTQKESLQVHTKFHADNLKVTDQLGRPAIGAIIFNRLWGVCSDFQMNVGMVQWQFPVNMVINLMVPMKWEFLDQLATISFTGRIPVHGLEALKMTDSGDASYALSIYTNSAICDHKTIMK
jgi:hypothetical protein